jgi:Cdc6-like AAA superfamily ATPase
MMQFNESTGQNEIITIADDDYDRIFTPFKQAQPENKDELDIYRDIVDEIPFHALINLSPQLVADYARYQARREEFVDRSIEKVCPHCEEPLKMTDMHKRSYDEIAIALKRLINLSTGGMEVGVDAI